MTICMLIRDSPCNQEPHAGLQILYEIRICNPACGSRLHGESLISMQMVDRYCSILQIIINEKVSDVNVSESSSE